MLRQFFFGAAALVCSLSSAPASSTQLVSARAADVRTAAVSALLSVCVCADESRKYNVSEAAVLELLVSVNGALLSRPVRQWHHTVASFLNFESTCSRFIDVNKLNPISQVLKGPS